MMDRMDSDWAAGGGGGGRRGMDGGGGRGMGRDGQLVSQGSFRGGRDPNAHMMAERALRGGGPGGPGGGGPGGPRGGPPGSVDSDRWARGVPLPPARGGGPGMGGAGMRGGAVAGLPALHKTESAFKAGLVLTDDPEEEEKQRKFKVCVLGVCWYGLCGEGLGECGRLLMGAGCWGLIP